MAEDDYEAAKAAGASPDATGHWPSQFKKAGHSRHYLPSALGTFDTKSSTIVPLNTPMNATQQETMRTEPTMSSEEVSSYMRSQQEQDMAKMYEPWNERAPYKDPYGGI